MNTLAETRSLAEVEAILSLIPDPEIPVISIRELGILQEVQLGTDDTGSQVVEITITPT